MHKCINDKVQVLNGFINVFGRNVLLMVTLTPYDCYDFYCGVHTLRDPSGYPSGGSPLIGTVTPGPNWPFLSPP